MKDRIAIPMDLAKAGKLRKKIGRILDNLNEDSDSYGKMRMMMDIVSFSMVLMMPGLSEESYTCSMLKLKILGVTDERIFETLRQRRDFEEESAMEEAKHIAKIINNE